MKNEKTTAELLKGLEFGIEQKLSGKRIINENLPEINENLPEIPACIDGGVIELFKNKYALIRATSKLNNEECYHILKLTICGRGWCNGRYDLTYSNDTFIKFMELAEGKFWYLFN